MLTGPTITYRVPVGFKIHLVFALQFCNTTRVELAFNLKCESLYSIKLIGLSLFSFFRYSADTSARFLACSPIDSILLLVRNIDFSFVSSYKDANYFFAMDLAYFIKRSFVISTCCRNSLISSFLLCLWSTMTLLLRFDEAANSINSGLDPSCK